MTLKYVGKDEGIPSITEAISTSLSNRKGVTYDEFCNVERELGECIRSAASKGYRSTHAMLDCTIIGRDEDELGRWSDFEREAVAEFAASRLSEMGYDADVAKDLSSIRIEW